MSCRYVFYKSGFDPHTLFLLGLDSCSCLLYNLLFLDLDVLNDGSCVLLFGSSSLTDLFGFILFE